MSIAAMTEVAFQRRKDVGSPTFPETTYSSLAAAANGKQADESSVNTALRTMVTYIPTEVLTLYLAVVAALHATSPQPPTAVLATHTSPVPPSVHASPLAFWCFVIGTPLVTWLVYAAKAITANKRAPLVAATIAFAAWALALPDQPFPQYPPALAGIVVLVASTILGLLAPLFSLPLQP